MPGPVPSTERRSWLARLVDVRPGEGLTAALAMLYFFSVLAGYFVLRPLRESLGLSGGADKLPVLFTASLVAMFVITPPFAWFVTKTPRRVFVPAVYASSIVCLCGFWIVLRSTTGTAGLWAAYAFYVFVSVFNLFVVSIFWGFMADLWNLQQAKRLFGFIASAGTLGAIVGGTLTQVLVVRLGTVDMLLVSVGFLAVALVCVLALIRAHHIDGRARPSEPTPQDAWRGLRLVAREPYLRSVASYVFLHGLVGTFLYMQQGQLVAASIPSLDERTELFALIDWSSNGLTLFLQLFFTSRLIRRFGVTFALVSQPVIAFCGWIVLAAALFWSTRLAGAGLAPGDLAPELLVLVGLQVLLRASNFATVRPAREALFTVVEREVKYKSKSFIDTFVYRLGDGIGAWSFVGLRALQASLPAIAVAVVPVAALWVGVGAVLGRRQRALSGER